MGNTLRYYLYPDVTPLDVAPLEFDPNYGFAEGKRVKKVMHASLGEMDSVLLDPEYRDYCAHLAINLFTCKQDNFPFSKPCGHIEQAWMACEYQEEVDRLRDYERERRLLHRKRRIQEKQYEIKKRNESEKLEEALESMNDRED